MKISTSLVFERSTQQMSSVQIDLAKTQAQVASSKELVHPSDAPDKAAAVQRLRSVLNRQESYTQTVRAVQTRLQAEETSLSSVTDLLNRIKELSVQSANDTLSGPNRQALGVEMKGLRDQMLSLANSQDNSGNYLFAGSRLREPPFATLQNGKVEYRGDQTRMSVSVGDQRSLPLNRSGSAVFVPVQRKDAMGQASGVGFFQAIDDMIAAVNSSDQAGMQRGIGDIDTMSQGVLLARADVGTDLSVVDQQTTVIEDTTLNLKTTLSSIEDLDYAAAVTKMNKQMLSLEAAQASFAKIAKLNLFNYIN